MRNNRQSKFYERKTFTLKNNVCVFKFIPHLPREEWGKVSQNVLGLNKCKTELKHSLLFFNTTIIIKRIRRAINVT